MVGSRARGQTPSHREASATPRVIEHPVSALQMGSHLSTGGSFLAIYYDRMLSPFNAVAMSLDIGQAPSVVLEITVTCSSLTRFTLDLNDTPASQPVMYSSRFRPSSS